MIQIFIVDYYKVFKTNGLTTYLKELTQPFGKGYSFNFIWVGCSKDFPSLTKRIAEHSQIHYYLPYDLVPKNQEYNLSVSTFLKNELKDRKNLIFHFNWINHCFFSWYLKQHIPCHTVLTKHCISWREMIAGQNHKVFYAIERQLKQKQKDQPKHDALVMESVQYSSVDQIICVTEYARQDLIGLMDYPENQISVIYNGLRSSARRNYSVSVLREKYGFKQDERIIFYAGKINERKGVFDLMKAFVLLLEKSDAKNLRLVIAGVGEIEHLLQYANSYWSSVTLTGFLEKEQLYDMYCLADIGIIPSYVEQCSYTAIEMMHHGLPMVVSEVDGLAEFIPDNCAVKVKRHIDPVGAHIDIQLLSEAINYLLNNREAAITNAENARRLALDQFNNEIMIAKTIETYRGLINKETKKNKSAVMKDGPLVSILLPCYNAEDYLQDCLNSIFSQSYENFELIIVNDGSTDKSKEIIFRNRDGRIRYMENENNEGIAKSLNKGVKMAKGEFIARIDADDLMHHQRLEKQVMCLRDPGNADIGIVGSSHYVIDKIGMPVSRTIYPLNDRAIKACMLFRNPFSHPSVMIRAHLLKKLRYLVKYKHNEDYNLWTRLGKQCGMVNLQECLTYYRAHEDNISRKFFETQQQNTLELLSDQLDYYGIEYSASDLSMHAAICFGYGKAFFKTPERITALKSWIDKVLLLYQLRLGDAFSDEDMDWTKRYVMGAYCKLIEY